MDRDMISRFKNIFETQRKHLVYGQGIVDEELSLKKDDMLDEADMSSSELEQSMRMRLRNRETLFLKKIDAALRRIELGRFGECESCENEIESRRLEARPTTTLCVNCKEEEERREHLHIDGHSHKSLGKKLRLA